MANDLGTEMGISPHSCQKKSTKIIQNLLYFRTQLYMNSLVCMSNIVTYDILNLYNKLCRNT